MRFAAAQDYRLFYEKELQFRRAMRYPPFSALANILVRDETAGSGHAHEHRDRASARLRRRKGCDSGAGRGARGARAEGVPLPDPDQGGQPQDVWERRSSACAVSRWSRNWGPTALVIDVDPLSLM